MVKNLFDLSNKVVLITGGSRGLGFQMAEGLGEMGAKLVLSARKLQDLEEAQSSLKKKGISAQIYDNDLQNSETTKLFVEKVLNSNGSIDILINNAGAAWGAPAEEHTIEAWNKIINLNLTAIFTLSQLVGKMCMIPKREGKIINIASIAGLVGTDPSFMPTIAYNSSKGGVVNFTKSLAAEWAQYNINVNAIAPGVFPSKMANGMIEKNKNYILDRTPLKRLGGNDDLKGLTILLASSASNYITGQTIAVDGGYSII